MSIARGLADIGGCPQDRKGVDALCRADQCLRTASLHVSHGLVCTRSRKVLLRIQARHQLLSLQVFEINYIATTSVSWQASCTFRSGMSCSFQLAVTWQVSCYSGRPTFQMQRRFSRLAVLLQNLRVLLPGNGLWLIEAPRRTSPMESVAQELPLSSCVTFLADMRKRGLALFGLPRCLECCEDFAACGGRVSLVRAAAWPVQHRTWPRAPCAWPRVHVLPTSPKPLAETCLLGDNDQNLSCNL